MGLTFRLGVLMALAICASLAAVAWLIGTLGRITQLGFVGRPGRSPWPGVSRWCRKWASRAMPNAPPPTSETWPTILAPSNSASLSRFLAIVILLATGIGFRSSPDQLQILQRLDWFRSPSPSGTLATRQHYVPE